MAANDKIIVLDPEAYWWVCWRIKGDLCGRTLFPLKTERVIDLMEKTVARYGRKNVWLERDESRTASPAGPVATGQSE